MSVSSDNKTFSLKIAIRNRDRNFNDVPHKSDKFTCHYIDDFGLIKKYE